MDMATTKSPDTENDTPPQSQPLKPLSTITTNGAYKKHHHQYYSPPQVVTYKECLKNHAARIGSHALDGCGEFMPSPTSTPTDPTSLKCAVCGCHRNFHRQEPDDSATPHHFLTFHRHNSSPPPPPMETLNSFSYAPNMLLALSTAAQDDHPSNNHHLTPATPTAVKGENPSGRKRFRTKFSQEQKVKMQSFSEKLGWRMQKSDEIMVEEFCRAIGVGKNVLKVWMHNNKSTLGKSAATIITTNTKKDDVIGSSKSNINGGKVISFENDISHNVSRNNNSPSDDDVHLHISAYGSSSSS